jgi:hypothetical protein
MIININLCDLHFSYFKEKYTNLDVSIMRYTVLKCNVKNCYKPAYNNINLDLDSQIKKSDVV